MTKVFYRFIALAGFFVLTACSNTERSEEIVQEDENTIEAVRETKFNAEHVFNSLPERKLVLNLISENKIEYNPDFLNDPNSVNKYTVEFFKAVNLGIYGSDLNIASSFDQTQESMVFLKCVNVLAGSLGVNSVFDQRLFDRVQEQSNNKDSILSIIIDAFKKVDETLKYNNRPATSAYILAGCWIEGLYVSCQMALANDNEKIIKTIVQQKESLKHLIVMLESSPLNERSKFMVKDLKQLYNAFNQAEGTKVYDKATLEPINNEIASLRRKMTTGA
ncbi:MAG: hypothetical protein V4635_04960 [Bacteroidota bacterium]